MICTPLQFRESRLPVELVLIFTAVLALLLGTAVYFLDRDWGSSAFLQPFADYQWPRFIVFGPFGGSLPSFMHAYAITALLIVALWPWPKTRLFVCLLWFSLASFLEWLQSQTSEALFYVSDRIAEDIPLMAYLRSYAIEGQFDYSDLLATAFGCLTALAVTLTITPHKQGGQT